MAAASSSPHKQRHRIISSSSSSSSWSQQDDEDEMGLLLPGLPDHLAQLCLSHLHPRLLFSVSRSWRRLLYSPSFPPFLSLYVLLSNNNNNSNSDSSSDDAVIEFASFDPISSTWTQLPPPPTHNPILLRHPSFISRQLPVQTASVAGRLVLLAGTDRRLLPALPRPLVFDPAYGNWLVGPRLSSPRRWCASGSAGGRLYVVSGVGSDFSSDTARSAERWDPAEEGTWDAICPLKDSRFSREPVDMVCTYSAAGGSKGKKKKKKVCMVNVKTKEGAAYDVESDRWEDIPVGLLSGWTGPAAGDEDGPIYVVDECIGLVRRYDDYWGSKNWTTVMVSENLKGANSIAVGGGRICIGGCNGGGTIIIIEEEETRKRRRRSWELLPPAGKRVMAMHVLPRITTTTTTGNSSSSSSLLLH